MRDQKDLVSTTTVVHQIHISKHQVNKIVHTIEGIHKQRICSTHQLKTQSKRQRKKYKMLGTILIYQVYKIIE